jgi:hypothetical protein
MTDVRRQVPEESCAEFQERLPRLFEAETEIGREPHLETCENCAELVRDLQYIAEQARLLLPIHDPSPKVWDEIRLAIQSGGTEEAGKTR